MSERLLEHHRVDELGQIHDAERERDIGIIKEYLLSDRNVWPAVQIRENRRGRRWRLSIR